MTYSRTSYNVPQKFKAIFHLKKTGNFKRLFFCGAKVFKSRIRKTNYLKLTEHRNSRIGKCG